MVTTIGHQRRPLMAFAPFPPFTAHQKLSFPPTLAANFCPTPSVFTPLAFNITCVTTLRQGRRTSDDSCGMR